jgi:predicted ATPase
MIRLATFRLDGFQSYETAQEVSFLPDVTLLAGQNNVGKSALLRALMLPVATQQGVDSGFNATYRWRLTAADLAEILRTEGSSELTSMSGQLRDDVEYHIIAELSLT